MSLHAGILRRKLLLAAALGCLNHGPLRAFEAQPRRMPWPAGGGAPALTLPLDDGTPWSLAEAKGQVVLLNFWASWCEPCRSEMPSLESLAAQHRGEGLLVMAINYRETDAAIKRFNQAMPLSLPILRDTDGGAARAFGVRIFPTTVAVARTGRVAFSVVGEADWGAEPPLQWVAELLQQRVTTAPDINRKT